MSPRLRLFITCVETVGRVVNAFNLFPPAGGLRVCLDFGACFPYSCLAPMPNVLGASTMNTVNTVNCLDREYRECRELPQFLNEVDREFHDFRTISGRGRIVGRHHFNCWSPWYLALVPCQVPRLPKIKMSSTNNSIFWTTVGTKAWYNCWSTVGTNALIVGLYRKLSMKPHI